MEIQVVTSFFHMPSNTFLAVTTSPHLVEHLVYITKVTALRIRFQKGYLELNYGLVPKFYDEGMKLFSLGGGVFVVASF